MMEKLSEKSEKFVYGMERRGKSQFWKQFLEYAKKHQTKEPKNDSNYIAFDELAEFSSEDYEKIMNWNVKRPNSIN